MGTRGCVAVREKTGWRGIYNQFDSYPEGLGVDVYEEAKKKGIRALAAEVLKYGDWREFLSKGICEYCGKKVGQPHTIEGTIFGFTGKDYFGDREKKIKAESIEELTAILRSEFNGTFADMAEVNALRQWPIIQNMQKAGYPDPKSLHHKHGKGPKDHLTDKKADALYIEWVYVLDPIENVIEVWKSRPAEGKLRKSGVSEYEHVKVTSIPMKGPAPDWKKVRRMGRKVVGDDEEES